tara:strand:- start:1359 stop:1781 length:423 start_codon:yes stop_codon:yes gene_type:complete
VRGVKKIVVHHTASPDSWTLEKTRAYHKGTKGWSDIGYHFVVETKPLAFRVGRRADVNGAHAKGVNSSSVGLVVIGNFVEHEMDRETLCFVAQSVADLCISYGLSTENVYGHKEVGTTPTACPGFDVEVLRDRVKEILSK